MYKIRYFKLDGVWYETIVSWHTATVVSPNAIHLEDWDNDSYQLTRVGVTQTEYWPVWTLKTWARITY